MKLSRKLALTLRVAAVLALGAALVPILASPAQALTSTTTSVSDNSSGVVTGGSFTFTATVSPIPDGGTVNFSATVGGNPVTTLPPSCTGANLSSGVATCTVSDAIAGSYSATADYSGDANYNGSPGSDTTANVGTAASTTSVIDSSSGVVTGGHFTFTATVTGVDSIIPTGTVTWTVTGPNGPASCASSTLNAIGQATCSITDAVGGAYSATATYGGDTNYDSSSGSDTTASVGTAASGTSVSFSGSATVGSAETVTATVSPTDNGGTVSFSATLGGNPVATLPASCTGASLSSGSATCTLTPTVAGTYAFTANYSGDSSYGSSSGTGSVAVSAAVVTPPPTHTTIIQTAPFSNSTTPTKSSSFTDTLTTTGNTGAVRFTTTTAPPGSTGGIRVSSTGVVTTTGALSVGSYTASGTDSDSSGDTGSWSYSLKVSATAITQVAPTTGTTTTRKAFSGQLKVSGSHGTVTYAQSTGAPHLTVSSSGKVSAPATLTAGTYKAKGTEKDTSGDTGTWGYSLTVTATKISQVAPITATTATGKAFTGKLEVSGSHGTVTYAQSTGAPDLKVSSSGAVSASATLAAGTYKATGTTKDTYGDTGTWSFALTVTATKISQVAPTTATTAPGKAFTGKLEVSGSHGTVTYAQSTGAPDLKVSPSGAISASATLAAGTYKAAGTARDTLGDTGTWSFALTVTASKLTQVAPTSATTTLGKAFSGQLEASGSHGTVTYTQTTGASRLTISSSGKVSAPATLAAGTYQATGTVKDTSGDTGTWSFTLTVTATVNKITQIAPTTATTATGRAFSGRLEVSGSRGTVTYAQSSGAPHLTVSSSGAVSAPATLAAGTYTATGTAKDTSGDTGTWSFALTVTAKKLTQAAPTIATTTTGKAFTGQLKVAGSHGTVTYAQSTGALVLKVSSSGKVSAAATLVAGTYRATGNARDTLGDTGNWSFALTVVATKLTQAAPDTARTATGKAFSGQLKVAGSHGTVTYAQSMGAPHLAVSSSGKISAPASLVAGTYKATGTARDTLGDTGTWSFTLTVVARKLTQAAPDTATSKAGKTFTGQLEVSGAHGTVTYAQSSGALDLEVSSSGKISAAATLVAGTYKATGTARDTLGDTGTWSFTLTVLASKLTQAAPDTATSKAGKAFTGQLKVSGSSGTVTYAQSSGAPHLKVSSSGKISAAAGLAAGIYKAKGTAKDTYGDTGTWTFTLTVKGAKLTQVAPTTGTTTAGKAFTTTLEVSGSHGRVTFAESSTGTQILTVLPSGTLLAPDIFTPGTYKITGTVKDSLGDAGTWSFTLTVEAAALPQNA